jgi:hypothetical protein
MPQNPEIEGLRPGRGLSLKLQAHKPNCGRKGRSLVECFGFQFPEAFLVSVAPSKIAESLRSFILVCIGVLEAFRQFHNLPHSRRPMST